VTSTAATEAEQKESVFYQFQSMFATLAQSHVDHYVPRGFWRAFKAGRPPPPRHPSHVQPSFRELYAAL